MVWKLSLGRILDGEEDGILRMHDEDVERKRKGNKGNSNKKSET